MQSPCFTASLRKVDSMEIVCLKFISASLYILKNKLKIETECPTVDFLVFEKKLLFFLLICWNETKVKSEHSQ